MGIVGKMGKYWLNSSYNPKMRQTCDIIMDHFVKYKRGTVCKCGNQKMSGAKQCVACFRKGKHGSLSYIYKFKPRKTKW